MENHRIQDIGIGYRHLLNQWVGIGYTIGIGYMIKNTRKV